MKYFTIAEMVKSDTADRRGINNALPQRYVENVLRLVEQVLDPLREWYGKCLQRLNPDDHCRLRKILRGGYKEDHPDAILTEEDMLNPTNDKADGKE